MKGLYIYDTESDGLYWEATHFHVMLFKEWHTNNFVLFLDKNAEGYEDAVAFANKKENVNLTILDFKDFQSWLRTGQVRGMACHNCFGHDFPLMKKLLGITYDLFPQSNINGIPIVMYDTLSMSQCLYPDRPLPEGCPAKVKNPLGGKAKTIGPHGLEAWGWRCGNHKVSIEDWRNLPLWRYVDRVWEDVIINELAYDMMIEEAQDDAHDIGIDWRAALRYNMMADFLMREQAFHGVVFNKEKAEKLIILIDKMMSDIAAFVEPQLPRKPKPKSRMVSFVSKPFTGDGSISKAGWKFAKDVLGFDVNLEALDVTAPPKTAFKGDGSLSANGKKWCIKNGCEDEQLMPEFIRTARHTFEQAKAVPDEVLPKVEQALRSGELPDDINMEPMLISNQGDIKEWLYTEAGWEPTEWNAKDVTKDDRKQSVPDDKVMLLVKEYLYDIRESIYVRSIENYYGEKISTLLAGGKVFREFCHKRARFLITTPKLKDQQGNLCPNLAKINGDMAKNIVKWLSLRNRRAVIKALDDNKTTGWLNNPRLAVDGRLPATYSGLTNTNRRKHSVCANVPKPSPDVLLGYEMRDLWTVPDGFLQLGCDASNLENMVAAWWAWVYGNDGGAYYEVVSQGDSHQNNADAYSRVCGHEISRNDSKPITYGILYGCGAQKAADMLGVDKDTGQRVIDAFWDANPGLKAAKEYLEKQWERSGKEYIRGIDGRKIYTRSKSSLLNAAFQSTGAIMMDRAGILYKMKSLDKNLEEKGIFRTIYYHKQYCGFIQ